jgi:DNA-binding SARP family transcriptional activator
MRHRLLGPVRVREGTTWSQINAPQPRLVLAVLLVEAGRTVATERLIDELWGDRRPRAAVSAVQGYVMRLRRRLGGRQLLTRGHGYEMVVDRDEVDVAVFDRLLDSARLGEALDLWQGPALADVPPSPTVTAEANRLEQRRVAALEEYFDAQLGAGRHADVVERLSGLVAEYPLRERLPAQLMLALYRSGRRAEALSVYQRVRRDLVEQLGVEPGARLIDIPRAILNDDRAAIGGPRPTAPTRSDRCCPAIRPA